MISLFHTFYLLHIVLYGHSPHLSRNVMKSWQMYKTFLEVRLFFAQKITPSDSCTLKCQKYCTAVLFIGFADAFSAPLYTEMTETLHSCCLYPCFRHHRTLKRPNGCTVVAVLQPGDNFRYHCTANRAKDVTAAATRWLRSIGWELSTVQATEIQYFC